MEKRKLTPEDFKTMKMPTMFVSASYEMVQPIIDKNQYLTKYMEGIKTGRQVRDGEGMVIMGAPLSHKSTLSAFIAKTFRRYGFPVHWASALSIQDALASKEVYVDENDFSEISMRDRLKDVDVLVVDNLGEELEAVHKRKYCVEVIQHRWQWAKLTIVNTALTSEDIQKEYGEIFMRRLFGNMLVVTTE